jgi:hypothetical protein
LFWRRDGKRLQTRTAAYAAATAHHDADDHAQDRRAQYVAPFGREIVMLLPHTPAMNSLSGMSPKASGGSAARARKSKEKSIEKRTKPATEIFPDKRRSQGVSGVCRFLDTSFLRRVMRL